MCSLEKNRGVGRKEKEGGERGGKKRRERKKERKEEREERTVVVQEMDSVVMGVCSLMGGKCWFVWFAATFPLFRLRALFVCSYAIESQGYTYWVMLKRRRALEWSQ